MTTRRPTSSRAQRQGRRGLDWEIIIVGGGPAGLSTWLHLHALEPELAARTLLVERAVYPRDKPCGGAITALGERILAGLDIGIDVPSVTVDAIALQFADRRVLMRRPAAMRVVARRDFDHHLARIAMQRGLLLHQGETLRAFRRNRDHVAVTTDRSTYTARVLVGADGSASAVRRLLRLAGRSPVARLVEVVTAAHPHRDAEPGRHFVTFDFRPNGSGIRGYFWHFPCPRAGGVGMNRGVFDASTPSDRGRARLASVLHASLRERQSVADPAALVAHPVRVYSAAAGLAAPRVLLVGDAAGVDPALGEGIAPALDYGDAAANYLVEAFAGGEFAFADYAAEIAAHPLGEWLDRRVELARRLYTDPIGGPDTPAILRAALFA